MRVRRHSAPPLLGGRRGRHLLLALGVIAGTFVAGYLIAALFIFPAPMFTGGTPLPRVLDLERADAQQQLAEAGFRVRFASEIPDPRRSAGRIVWQEPAPGTILPEGSAVRLTPSAGPSQVTLPDLSGLDVTEASRILNVLGLESIIEDSVTSGSEAGTVLATRPGPGAARAPGSRIGLVLSSGGAPRPVPDVMGRSLEQARVALESAGLRVGRVTSGFLPQAEGRVVQQVPAAGTRAAPDVRVDLVIDREGSL
jgi:serine/threonine-protein kinase